MSLASRPAPGTGGTTTTITLAEVEIMLNEWTTAGRVLAVAVGAALLAGLSAAPATAQPTDLDVVAVAGSDEKLWVYDSHDRAWSDLGGVLTGTPAIATGNHDLYFFAVGTDNNVWVRTYERDWARYGLAGTNCVGVSAVVSGPMLAVSCRGSDGAAWVTQSREPRSGLPRAGTWRSLGGVVQYGVSVGDASTTASAAQFLYAAVGSDNSIWADEGAGWGQIGGQCTGAASLSEFAEALGCRGADGALWVLEDRWRSFGGQIVDKPGVTVHENGVVRAYVTGTGGSIWTSSGSGWTRLSGASTYGVAVVSFPS